MKKLVTSYTFDASAKTVLAADFSTLEGILLITNVTDNIIIYNFAGSGKGGTLASTTLTLDYDTTAMDDTDKLQVWVDNGVTQAVSGTVTANAGTNLNTSALALSATQTDKSQFTKLTDGTDTALVTASGEQNVLATAQPGVDIGDVTINNSTGGSAVNIQDGGNSITVDGTVAASNLPTTVDTNSGNKSASTLRVVLATDQPALTNKLLVTPDSVALPANQSVNVAQINGVTTTMGNGASGTGVQRVTLANDSTGIVALTTGSAQIGHLEANQSTNVAQMNGVTVTMGNGASGTGVQRVTLANDSTGQVALAAGSAAIGKLAANSGVDIGDVDVTTVGTVTPGTAATSLGKAEDAAHTTGDVGVMALGVRNDTLADVTNTTADYSQVSTDIKGRVMTAGAPRGLKGTFQVALSNTTSETTILAATASTFHDVYGLILANTGATTTKVSIRDDTAGTVRAIIEVPTLETRGFMLPVDSAIPQTAVNKNWTAQCASATTALEVTGFYVSMV